MVLYGAVPVLDSIPSRGVVLCFVVQYRILSYCVLSYRSVKPCIVLCFLDLCCILLRPIEVFTGAVMYFKVMS